MMIWYWMVVFPCSNHLHMLDLQSLISIHMVTPSGLRSIALVTFFIYRFSSFYIIFMDGLVRCNPMQGHNQIRHLFSVSKKQKLLWWKRKEKVCGGTLPTTTHESNIWICKRVWFQQCQRIMFIFIFIVWYNYNALHYNVIKY